MWVRGEGKGEGKGEVRAPGSGLGVYRVVNV